MKDRFFNPYVGENYCNGFYNGKKVLVLGASHYCVYNDQSEKYKCPVHSICTSTNIKDSSEFNEKCCYNKDNPTKDNSSVAKLENSTIDDLDTFLKDESGDYKSYSIFTESLIGADDFGLTERKSVWDRLAFANYVQYFVPTIDTPRQTKTDLRNFDALLKTIRVLKPDIIVIWGTKVTDHFQEDYFKRYFQSKVKLLELQKNDYYWKLEYLGHKIVIVNPYHPSSRIWNSNVARFIRAFKCALETPYDEISNIQPFPKKEC